MKYLLPISTILIRSRGLLAQTKLARGKAAMFPWALIRLKRMIVLWMMVSGFAVQAQSSNSGLELGGAHIIVDAEEYHQVFIGIGSSVSFYNQYFSLSDSDREAVLKLLAEDLNLKFAKNYVGDYPANDPFEFESSATYWSDLKRYNPDINFQLTVNNLPDHLEGDDGHDPTIDGVLDEIADYYFQALEYYHNEGLTVLQLDVINERGLSEKVTDLFDIGIDKLREIINDPLKNSNGVPMPQVCGPSTWSAASPTKWIEDWKENRPNAWNNVDVVTTHGYQQGTFENYKATFDAAEGKPFYNNEQTGKIQDDEGTGDSAVDDLAKQFVGGEEPDHIGDVSIAMRMSDVINAGGNAFFPFRLTNSNGNNAALVGTKDGSYQPSKIYYGVKHISSVQPDSSYRVGHTSSLTEDYRIVTFRKPGEDTVYVHITNVWPETQNIKIAIGDGNEAYGIKSVVAWTSNEELEFAQVRDESLDQSINAIEFTVTPHSVNTLKLAVDPNGFQVQIDEPIIDEPINLARGKTVTFPSATTGSGALDNITDGAISTSDDDRWVSNGDAIGSEEYLFVDLESEVTVAGYLLYHQSFRALTSYEVAYRDVNTGAYMVVESAPGTTGVSSDVNNVLLSSYFFDTPISTDMMRFELLEAGDNKARIVEIEIYNESFLPAPPTNFSYTADLSTVSSPKVNLSWDDSADEDEYKLTVKGATKPDQEIILLQDATSYVLNMDYGVNFTLTLEAVNTEGSAAADPIVFNITHPNNVAFGKPATASSESNSSRTADKAVDGDRNSSSGARWQTEDVTAAHFIEVDLGGNHTITGYQFNVLGNQPTAWHLQYWDGDSWEVAHEITSGATETAIIQDQENGNDIYVYEYTFTSQVTTDVRLLFDAATPELKMYELEVYGTFTAKTWTGTGWSPSSPSSNDVVIIDGMYVTSDHGSLSDVGSIEISETGSLVISPGTYVQTHSFIVNNGSATIQSGGSLHPGNTISGDPWIVERNTPHSNGQYSLVGTPVEDAYSTVGDLGSLAYEYDETVPYDPSGNEGLDRFVEKTDSEEGITRGKGYFSAYTETLSFTGIPNRGTITVPVTYTDHDLSNTTAENSYEGFNLLANPYASAISPSEFVSANSSYNGALYFWDDNGSNLERGDNADYIVWNGIGSVGSTPANSSVGWDEHIRSGQGFFVKVDEAATSAQFTENMWVVGNNGDDYFFRTASEKQRLRLSLTSKQGAYQETLIGFEEDATEGVDRLYDALKFSDSDDQLYSLIGDRRYAIQGLPILQETLTLPIGFNVAKSGQYRLNVVDFQNGGGYEVTLIDHSFGAMVNLSEKETYAFTTDKGEVTDRFSIQLRPSAVLGEALSEDGVRYTISEDKLEVVLAEGVRFADVTITDISGRRLLSATYGREELRAIPFHFHRNQMYILRIATNDHSLIQKVVLQ